MTRTRTIAVAGAVGAGVLASSAMLAPTLTASADSGTDGASERATHQAAKSAAGKLDIFKCDGGPNKQVFNHGLYDGYFFVDDNTTKTLPGPIKFKGPKKGKDVVSVAISTSSYIYGGGGAVQVQALLDGVPMRPGQFNDPIWWAYDQDGGYTAGDTVQFCGKVGKGKHRIRIQVSGTNSHVELWDTLVHAEVND